MLRMPLQPVALELLRQTGPMAVSSANVSGRPPATTAAEAQHQLGISSTFTSTAGPPRSRPPPPSSTSPARPHGSCGRAGQRAGARSCARRRPRRVDRPRGRHHDHDARSSDREVILALSERGAGVPLRELVLVGLTAAIVTYFATGGVRVLATRLGALACPRKRDVHPCPRREWAALPCTSGHHRGLPGLPAAGAQPGLVPLLGMPAVVIAGGLVMGIGLIDDRWGWTR